VVRVFLLGPNRWPSTTTDPEAGLKIRRSLIQDNEDLDAEWVLMEDSKRPGTMTAKFLAIVKDPATTHVFFLWPRDCKMAGPEDELALWQALKELTGVAPELYLFHQAGVLEVNPVRGEHEVAILDSQGRSPYLRELLQYGVFLQEWMDLEDLRREIRNVLRSDVGVPVRQHRGVVHFGSRADESRSGTPSG